MQNSAFAAAFHSPSGSAGLPLASGVARGANAPAVDAENSLKPVNSIPRSTTNVVQAIKGTPADPGQKGAPAHISSSADAQEGRDGRTVKGKVAGESPAVPPGLVADSNISIRRPFDLLRRAAARFGNYPWLLTSEQDGGDGLVEITYRQGYAVALAVGSGLDRLVPPSQLPQRDGANEPLRLVGTWAANSVELLLADFGAGAFGMTVVPMHPEMNARRFLEVMIHTQMTHLCTDWRHLEIVLDLREGGQLSNLSALITLDAVGDQAMQRAHALDLTLVDFWELADSPNGIGEQRLKSLHRSGFDTQEIAAVIYPRESIQGVFQADVLRYTLALSMPFNGAMLTNENVLASLDTLTDWRARALSIVEADRMLCIDSLASIHQRVLHLAVVDAGATVAFARSGLLTLGDDLEAFHPTIVAGSGGILPVLHAAARRTLKSLGRLRRFWVLLKLRWRARQYWQTGDFELLGKPPFEELKAQLASVHTIIAAPALASSELIKELQLLYSVACCSAETGIAFSSREQNSSSGSTEGSTGASAVGASSEFERMRAAPLGWPSPVVAVDLEELSAADQVNTIDYHGDEVPGRRAGGSSLVLRSSEENHQQIVSIGSSSSRFSTRKIHGVTEVYGFALSGACVRLAQGRDRYSGSLCFCRFACVFVALPLSPVELLRIDFDSLAFLFKYGAIPHQLLPLSACNSVAKLPCFVASFIRHFDSLLLPSSGYYRHQTAFQRQLTPRGFYRTGLVGISAGDGLPLLLTSALPRSVLTAEGEFIDLEEAERQIRKVHIVKRVLLYVDDFHFSDEYGASYEELVSLPALRKFVLHAIQEETSLSLEHFELPKAVYLVPHDVALPVGVFDQDKNGANKYSRTMRRRQLAEAYAQPIQEMYEALAQ
ncbi:AMP-binding enzyme family protein, related [Eimeria acervulina]|uniref:AMP-binding enzyme family protein, related n=1 Tax=Eimeria acervulina TaxID=5801 RepID=U6GHB4_EIMAC|nr:AMP-binding enzyme family protein, related [Eimeria acervulina]CDI78967.1 AMP-binding enzyme family protein, related [Eimeria acervulina]